MPPRRPTSPSRASEGIGPASWNHWTRRSSPSTSHVPLDDPADHDDRRDPAALAADRTPASGWRDVAVGRPGPEHVLVEPGEQPDGVRRTRREQPVEIGGQDDGWFALEVDLREGVAELREPAGELALAEPAAGEPRAEGREGRRSVGAQVRGDRPWRGLVRRRGCDPAAAGRGRVGEGHLVALARTEAQVALPGDGLEQRAPPRAERIADVVEAGPLRHLGDERFPGQDPPVEDVAHREAERLDALGGHAEVLDPGRTFPRAAGGHEREERPGVLGGEEVQGAAHRPRLDEPAVGERRAHLTGHGIPAADADGELRRRGDLRLDPAQSADHGLDRGAPDRIQQVALHPPGERLSPADSGDRRSGHRPEDNPRT